MRLDYTDPACLKDIVEALIFATDEPLSAQALRSLILDEPMKRIIPTENGEAPAADMFNPPAEEEQKKSKKTVLDLAVIREAVNLLNAELEDTGRPYRIVEIAGG